jgi:hypothetical protein
MRYDYEGKNKEAAPFCNNSMYFNFHRIRYSIRDTRTSFVYRHYEIHRHSSNGFSV